MKPIKYRWNLWQIYTGKWEKAQHGFLAILSIALTVWGFSNGWILGVITLAFWANVTYTSTMKDVWGNAYQQTESLRFVGWHLNKALNEWTFVKATKVGNKYTLDPDKTTVDPDAIDDDIYTDEIVIRRGMSIDGDPLIASSIPEELSPEIVIGMLEHAKLEYTYDSLGNPHE